MPLLVTEGCLDVRPREYLAYKPYKTHFNPNINGDVPFISGVQSFTKRDALPSGMWME